LHRRKQVSEIVGRDYLWNTFAGGALISSAYFNTGVSSQGSSKRLADSPNQGDQPNQEDGPNLEGHTSNPLCALWIASLSVYPFFNPHGCRIRINCYKPLLRASITACGKTSSG
jgi:hypothetical protein